MSETQTFADRVRARFPEGLTGIIAIGGTRTTFILEYNRSTAITRSSPCFLSAAART
jgi:hypothetical protein